MIQKTKEVADEYIKAYTLRDNLYYQLYHWWFAEFSRFITGTQISNFVIKDKFKGADIYLTYDELAVKDRPDEVNYDNRYYVYLSSVFLDPDAESDAVIKSWPVISNIKGTPRASFETILNAVEKLIKRNIAGVNNDIAALKEYLGDKNE